MQKRQKFRRKTNLKMAKTVFFAITMLSISLNDSSLFLTIEFLSPSSSVQQKA
jgi:hypothetical protein